MICLCYLFISKDFSPKKLNDFSSVYSWGNILIIFQTKEKIPSYRILRQLWTVICKTPMHLLQWRTNAASFVSNSEIVRVCRGMVFYDVCFNLLWMTHGLKQFVFNASHNCGMPQVVPDLQQHLSLCLISPLCTMWPTPAFSQYCSRDCVILPKC